MLAFKRLLIQSPYPLATKESCVVTLAAQCGHWQAKGKRGFTCTKTSCR